MSCARLKRFIADRFVVLAFFFNILFIYVWGYLLWGTTEVWSAEWWLEECGHFLWSFFHTVIILSYTKRHYELELRHDREKIENRAWLWVINFSVFIWEGFESIHDASGFFHTMAQLGSRDTMMDIFLSGLMGPLLAIGYARWKDGVHMLFIADRVKEANEHDWQLIHAALHRISVRTADNKPHMARGLRELVRKEWEECHRALPVIKSLYNVVVRESRRERRRHKNFSNKE